jgi:hypothetical protein
LYEAGWDREHVLKFKSILSGLDESLRKEWIDDNLDYHSHHMLRGLDFWGVAMRNGDIVKAAVDLQALLVKIRKNS